MFVLWTVKSSARKGTSYLLSGSADGWVWMWRVLIAGLGSAPKNILLSFIPFR